MRDIIGILIMSAILTIALFVFTHWAPDMAAFTAATARAFAR